jgi:hypothetical protein
MENQTANHSIQKWVSLPPVPGKFLDIVGQDPSNSKSNRLHVDIFRFCFIHLKYIPRIPLKRSVSFMKPLNFNRLFLKLNRLIYNILSVHPKHSFPLSLGGLGSSRPQQIQYLFSVAIGSPITSFRAMTMFCRTDNILLNIPHTQVRM